MSGNQGGHTKALDRTKRKGLGKQTGSHLQSQNFLHQLQGRPSSRCDQLGWRRAAAAQAAT